MHAVRGLYGGRGGGWGGGGEGGGGGGGGSDGGGGDGGEGGGGGDGPSLQQPSQSQPKALSCVQLNEANFSRQVSPPQGRAHTGGPGDGGNGGGDGGGAEGGDGDGGGGASVQQPVQSQLSAVSSAQVKVPSWPWQVLDPHETEHAGGLGGGEPAGGGGGGASQQPVQSQPSKVRAEHEERAKKSPHVPPWHTFEHAAGGGGGDSSPDMASDGDRQRTALPPS